MDHARRCTQAAADRQNIYAWLAIKEQAFNDFLLTGPPESRLFHTLKMAETVVPCDACGQHFPGREGCGDCSKCIKLAAYEIGSKEYLDTQVSF